ncbi:DNA polymerase III, epsilon subunit [Fodinibius roseus]|uniref:DNA polymerase III, epsilon subunit n=1 Tax=Fodinibius roseus TaxID=1194090 RepID=A0A1M4VVF8_9BACT|nr:3'-5' exonuclease [Fodinibius roseus]SHE72900.1 DNA polymerase III, epsilon subunit [Fodinibius roseus]
MDWFNFLTGQKARQSSFVVDYIRRFENKKADSDEPVSRCSFVALDTETTGLEVKRDYIVSYGSVAIRSYAIKVNRARQLYLHPKKESTKEAIKVHEIINAKDTLSLRSFVKLFLGDIGHAVLVGHNIGFDIAMLEKAARPFGLKKIRNHRLDTYDLAVRLELGKHTDYSLINKKDYQLDALCRRYHIPLDDRHTAAGDAFLTAQLFLKLLKIAEKRGITTLGSLLS